MFSKAGISPDPVKVSAIRESQRPAKGVTLGWHLNTLDTLLIIQLWVNQCVGVKKNNNPRRKMSQWVIFRRRKMTHGHYSKKKWPLICRINVILSKFSTLYVMKNDPCRILTPLFWGYFIFWVCKKETAQCCNVNKVSK